MPKGTSGQKRKADVIGNAVRMSPAMACGLEQRLWDIGDIVKLVEKWEAAA
jgi:hypothetical protein